MSTMMTNMTPANTKVSVSVEGRNQNHPMVHFATTAAKKGNARTTIGWGCVMLVLWSSGKQQRREAPTCLLEHWSEPTPLYVVNVARIMPACTNPDPEMLAKSPSAQRKDNVDVLFPQSE